MNDIRSNLNYPIITGRPSPSHKTGAGKKPDRPGSSFGDLLQKSMESQAGTRRLTFSKHARNRTMERGIQLSQQDIDRLAGAVGTAESKGITDTLVMMNDTAFIVNVPSGVVVTVFDGSESENVFTHIDGAVIL